MLQATIMAKRIVAVLSPAYFASQFAESEWRTAFAALLHLAKGAAGG